MSIESIPALGSAAANLPAQAATPQGVATTDFGALPTGASASDNSEFSDALGRIHDQMTQSRLGGGAADPVGRQVEDMLPSPWKNGAAARMADSQAAPNAVNSTQGAHEVLQRSFDHAIFVSLVGQAMSGVSKSTSTLIHQS